MANKRDPFLMVPYSLLRTPEYGRFFDGAAVGFLYRYLRTGVRRQGVGSLKYTNPGGWLTEVSTLYDNGWLATYTSIKDLMDASGFSRRTLNTHLTTLETLKLVNIKQFGDGYIVVLGKRLMLNSQSGYSVGDAHEGFFIDEWESWLERDEYEFRKMLIEKLAPSAQRGKFLERLEDEKLSSGQNFPKPWQNFANNEDYETVDETRSERDELAVENLPRIDKLRIDNKISKSDPPRGESTKSMLDTHKTYVNHILASETYDDALVWAREATANDVPLSVVNPALAKFLKDTRYPRYPRLSAALDAFNEDDKNPHVGLALIWSALHEDTTGVVSSKNTKFYREVVGAYKRSLLSQYSVRQCLWTIHHVMEDGKNVEFLSKGGRNLITVVKQNAGKWQEILEAQRIAKLEAEAARLKDKEYEEREAKRAAEPVEVPELSPYMQHLLDEATRHSERKAKVKEIMRGE